jgi:hypothetical protein
MTSPRLSRTAYENGYSTLSLVAVALVFAPIGITLALMRAGILACGPAGGFACSRPIMECVVAVGPISAVLVLAAVGGRMMVRRAHDLGEDLPYWQAFLDAPTRRSPLQRRLRTEEGMPGPNRFGPPPAN